MAVIELGVVSADDQPVPPWRPRPRLPAAVVVVVLCLLAVTGSAPPRSHGFAELWSVAFRAETDFFRVVGDRVLVLSSAGGRRLTAYDRGTGAARWSTTGLDDAVWIDESDAGVVLLPAGNRSVEYDLGAGQTGIREFTPDVIAVDLATGRRLWRRPGEFLRAHAGRALMVDWNQPGNAVRGLRVVDLRDGRTAWSPAALGPQAWVAIGTGDTDRVVLARPGGRIAVHDFADGRLVAEGTVPWPEVTDFSTVISVADHTFTVHSAVGELSSVAVHDTETLREKWHATSAGGGFYTCGTIMCGNQNDGIAGYDLSTGDALWRLKGNGYGSELSAGRLLVEIGQEQAHRIMIDSRTGRELADLGAAQLTTTRGDSGPWYLTHDTESPPGRTAVAELDGRTGEIVLRGSLAGPTGFGCESSGDVLVCSSPEALTATDVGRVS